MDVVKQTLLFWGGIILGMIVQTVNIAGGSPNACIVLILIHITWGVYCHIAFKRKRIEEQSS
jgi:hypothetical protein